MTKQQELEFYKCALMDWSKPVDEAFETNTRFGFCAYFMWREFPIDIEEVIESFDGHNLGEDFNTLYSLRTNKLFCSRYWFSGVGTTEKGRKERVKALKKAIEILEKELKSESHE